MKLTKTQQILLGATIIGIPLVVIGIASTLRRDLAKLIIESSSGGTTDPSPATYESPSGSVITVTAIPDEGYYFAGWTFDGASLGTDNQITVKVETFHTLIATFTLAPNGGTFPVSITPLNVPINVIQNYGGIAPIAGHYKVRPFLEDWVTEAYLEKAMLFKVADAAGKGVANIPVLLWTSDVPDSEGGNIRLAGDVHTSANPLELKTLYDGTLSVPVGYISADLKQLSIEHLTCILGPIPWAYPMYECRSTGIGVFFYSCGGDYHTILLPNFVFAQVKGTILQTIGSANCQIHIKHAYGP